MSRKKITLPALAAARIASSSFAAEISLLNPCAPVHKSAVPLMIAPGLNQFVTGTQ